jgi:hypothetical protein
VALILWEIVLIFSLFLILAKLTRVRNIPKKMVPTIFEVWECNGQVPETIRGADGFLGLDLPKLFTVF